MWGCYALCKMCQREAAARSALKQRVAEAGALEAVVVAMRAHPCLQKMWGWEALNAVCYGDDAAAPARRQRAREAGALEAVAAAIEAHPEREDVQKQGHAARALLIA